MEASRLCIKLLCFCKPGVKTSEKAFHNSKSSVCAKVLKKVKFLAEYTYTSVT